MSKTTLPFGRIDSITLDMALPGVFAGQEKEGHVALSEVWMHSLTFSRPGRYMIEAESGAGKSSLCSFIYGNRSDYLGHILFNGTDVRTLSIEQWCQVRLRHLAMLPQEMKLFAELTVMENIQIKNRLTGTCTDEQIMDMLERLGIAEKAGQPAGRLSVGQQQRVAVIRTLCQPFDFIILDEPVSHLDAANNGRVAELVTEAARRNDGAIITTSVGNPLVLDEAKHIRL